MFSTWLFFSFVLAFSFAWQAQAELKDVFFHYMVGGITADHALTDVTEAHGLGVDAFALNVVCNDWWSADAVANLFAAANDVGFKLFFSFDMTHWTAPEQFMPLLLQYISNPAYYVHENLPFVSTFNGATLTFGESSPNQGWQIHYMDVLAAAGHQSYFVPAFEDAPDGPNNFFNTYPIVQGAMNWDSWPFESDGTAPVSTKNDTLYQSGAHAAGKTFMMGFSPLQFKHLPSLGNWYRSGANNLADRIPQVLNLQPDFLEIQTWNDGGESHYFGNLWPEAISGSGITAYTDGYNHTGWQELLPPFIEAYKSGAGPDSMVPTNGRPVQGAFWFHAMLQNSSCPSDTMGKPSGIENVQDVISIALYVAAGTDVTLIVSSGGTELTQLNASTGYNSWTVPNMRLGQQMVEVVGSDNAVIASGTGSMDVVASASLYNYNYQVVGF